MRPVSVLSIALVLVMALFVVVGARHRRPARPAAAAATPAGAIAHQWAPAAVPAEEAPAEEPPLGPARRLGDADQALLAPDEAVETGTLAGDDGDAPRTFSLRLARAMLAPGQPLEARITVGPAGAQPTPFSVRAVEVRQTETGYSERESGWTTRADGDAQVLTWTPPDMQLDNGQRELIVTLDVRGVSRVASAPFTMQYAPPVRALEGVTVRVDDEAVHVEVPMEAKGRWACQLSANLHDQLGRPLQHTDWMGTVTDGTRVPLEFSRALLRRDPRSGLGLSVRQFAGTCRASTEADVVATAARIDTVAELYAFELGLDGPG